MQLTKIIALAFMLIATPLAASPSSQKLGIALAHLSHTASHSAPAKSSQSLHAAIYYEWSSFYESGFYLGAETSLGFSTGDLSHGYMIDGAQNLSTYTPKGGLNLYAPTHLKLGYAFLKSEYDAPLVLSSGLVMGAYISSSGNAPIIGDIGSYYLPLELSGHLRLKPKFALEYLLAYDHLLASSVNVSGSITQNARLDISHGYALRANLGVRYYVSDSSYFFATAFVSFESLGRSTSAEVTTTNTNTPGVLPNTSATISYPGTHTTYAGLRVGFGF